MLTELERADGWRQGTSRERALAADCYRQWLPKLDLKDPENRRRARWLLGVPNARDDDTVALAEDVARRTDGVLRCIAQSIIVLCHAHQGRMESAERLARSMIDEHKGAGNDNEVRAYLALASTLAWQAREVELLVTVRQATVLAKRLGALPPELEVSLLQRRLAALDVFGASFDGQRETAGRILELCDELREDWAHGLRAAAWGRLVYLAIESGDLPAAEANLAAQRACLPPSVPRTWRRNIAVLRSHVDLLAGRPAIAADRLESSDDALEHPVLGAEGGFRVLRVRALLAAKRPDRAAERAEELVSWLERCRDRRCSSPWRSACELAALRVGGEGRLARRAIDVASSLVLGRIVEIQRFFSERSDLLDEHFEYVRRHLREAEEGYRKLLNPLRDTVPEAAAATVAPDRTFTLICSWCTRVKYGMHWQPIGQFFAHSFPVSTTHGLCPDCRRRWPTAAS